MRIVLEKQVLFIYLIPIWIVVRIVLLYLTKKSRGNFSLKREVILNILFIYILCLLSITLFPLFITFGGHNNCISANLIPLVGTIKEILVTNSDSDFQNFMNIFWIKNIVGNMLLMVPLGIMLPVLWEKFHIFSKTILFAFCLSLSIEILQLLSGYIGNIRAFDIDDILLNTAGACIGFILYNRFIKSKIKKFNHQ